jgi:hypothetical protein
MNTVNMGNLGLSDQECDDLVAFMNTLTDGYVIPPPAPSGTPGANSAR